MAEVYSNGYVDGLARRTLDLEAQIAAQRGENQSLSMRIDELKLEADRQTHVIRRMVNRESHCEHADDGRHQCKHCDAYYPTPAVKPAIPKGNEK